MIETWQSMVVTLVAQFRLLQDTWRRQREPLERLTADGERRRVSTHSSSW